MPFTGLDRKCIYSLAISSFPFCSFSWGDIYALVLPGLAASGIASSTTILYHSLLWPTIFLILTNTSRAACFVYHQDTPFQPDPRLILFQHHQGPSLTITNGRSPIQSGPVIPKYSNLLPVTNQVLRRPHWLTLQVQPRHNLFLYILFLLCYTIYISRHHHAFMHHFFTNSGVYYKNMHLVPTHTLFFPNPRDTTTNMRGCISFLLISLLNAWLAHYHQIFRFITAVHLFFIEFLFVFLSQLPRLPTHWMMGVGGMSHGRLISCPYKASCYIYR